MACCASGYNASAHRMSSAVTSQVRSRCCGVFPATRTSERTTPEAGDPAFSVRTAELELIDVEGTIVDIRTSQTARMDQMHHFELATCARLTPGASGVVRSHLRKMMLEELERRNYAT